MYNFNQLAMEAETKQAEFHKNAEQARLAQIALGGRRFRLIGWRLPRVRLQPLISKPAAEREVTRKPASSQV